MPGVRSEGVRGVKSKRLLQSVAIIFLATAVSRVLGLVREMVVADHFGATSDYDAFVVAFIIPNLLRLLLAEGALSTAFIPLFSERLQRGRERAAHFASNVLNLGLIGFPLLVALGIWLAPHVVPFLADGFDLAKQQLTIGLMRLTFPFIMLVGLSAILMGVLNGHDRFFAPAFAPVFFNVGMILGAVVIAPRVDPPIMGLAYGVLLGGLGQLLFQLPFVRGRLGYRWALDPRDETVRRLTALMLPMVLGLVVVELNVLVDNKLASHLASGQIASMQYAVRLFQLPLGLFAVALATALLPRLSRFAAGEQLSELRESLLQGLRLAGYILLPAAVGLIVLGGPIISLLFEHGRFDAEAAETTLYVLRFLALGLVAYGMTMLVTRTFYALQETRRPVLSSGVAVAVNIGLDLALIKPLGIGGLALATASAGVVQVCLLLVLLERRLQAPLLRPIGLDLAKMTGCAALMGVVIDLTGNLLGSIGPIVRVPAGLAVGMVSYGLLTWGMGVMPPLDVSQPVRAMLEARLPRRLGWVDRGESRGG